MNILNKENRIIKEIMGVKDDIKFRISLYEPESDIFIINIKGYFKEEVLFVEFNSWDFMVSKARKIKTDRLEIKSEDFDNMFFKAEIPILNYEKEELNKIVIPRFILSSNLMFAFPSVEVKSIGQVLYNPSGICMEIISK